MKYILFILSTYFVFCALFVALIQKNVYGSFLALGLLFYNLSQLEK